MYSTNAELAIWCIENCIFQFRFLVPCTTIQPTNRRANCMNKRCLPFLNAAKEPLNARNVLHWMNSTSTYRAAHSWIWILCSAHMPIMYSICPFIVHAFLSLCLFFGSFFVCSHFLFIPSFRSFFLCVYPSSLRFVNTIDIVAVVIVVGIVFFIVYSWYLLFALWLSATLTKCKSCDWCRCCCSRKTKTCWTKSSKKFPLILRIYTSLIVRDRYAVV